MSSFIGQINHRTVETNGIRMHVAEQGTGPLVILCHGSPESWYSWRHQLGALAAAGFHAVAPDMRGYGHTDAPAELERDVRATMRRLAFSGSGDAPGRDNVAMVPRAGGFLDQTTDPDTLPPWLTAAAIEFYAGEFGRTGFRGGLNWYRNIDRNWELLAPFAGAVVPVPALYVGGARDLVLGFKGMDRLLPALKQFVPHLRESIILPGCGHRAQQAR